MTDEKKASKNPRFFSESSIVKTPEKGASSSKDPVPFGLEMQEKFADENVHAKQHAPSMHPSPTNTPGGPDSSFDFDWEF